MKKKAIILGLITSMAGLTFAGCASSGSTETTTTTSAIDVSVPEEVTTTTAKIGFENNVLTINDATIAITDYEVLAAGQGRNKEYDGSGPVIVFYYDATNLSDKELSADILWISCFEAVQEDANAAKALDVAAVDISDLEYNPGDTIKKGGTVSSAIAYDLKDMETPVKLKAKQGTTGKDLGYQIFNLVTAN